MAVRRRAARKKPEIPAELRAALGRHRPPAAVIARLSALLAEKNAGLRRRRIIGEAVDGFTFAYVWEPDGSFRFTEIDKNCVKLVGRTAEELFADPHSIIDAFDAVTREEFRARHDEHARALRPMDAEIPLKAENGSRRWVRLIVRPAPLPRGLVGWNGAMIDIGRRRDAERAAARAAERLRDMVDSLAEGLALFDRDDRLVLCNQRFRELYPPEVRPAIAPGSTCEEILRATVAAGLVDIGEDSADEWVAKRLAAHRKGSRRELALANGGTILVDERRTRDGGVVATYTDITRLKRQEAEIRRQSALLQTTLEHLDQGISVLDRDLRLVAYNRRFFDLFGFPPELGVPGTPLERFLRHHAERGEYGPGDPDALVRRRLEEIRQDPGQVVESTRPDGSVLEVRSNPLPDGGLVTSFSDITEQRQAERRLAAAKEEAEAASRTKSEFLANMSHELRTPLNAIIGFSDVMQSELLGPLGARYRSYAQDIQQSGEHLLKIINDILDLSKIEAGRLTLHEEVVDPAAMARDCARLVRARAEEAGVTLQLRMPADAPRQLSADAVKLKQILLNLLSNAVKFTPRGGRVEVALLRGSAGNLEIAVRDTGIGMSESEIAIALQPFRQIESTFARTHEGTGLGLPLTKALVELHGGSMRIESRPGDGTTVTVAFPVERVWAAA
jgi:signal transduction histidine kinase